MRESLNDRLERFMKKHPNVWVDGREIAKVAGAYGWRTRVSQCRREKGMTIENRLRHQVTLYGKYTISEYRYVPDARCEQVAS